MEEIEKTQQAKKEPA
jgi:hypothetical protein